MGAKRRRPYGRKSSRRIAGDRSASHGRITVRRVENVFELVHPACVRRRAADLEQVRVMLEAGEVDIARDELRWLLIDCRELIEAHRLLGEIAVSGGDLAMARAHFGYAYDLGRKAIPPDGLPGPLPYARKSNRAFFEAGEGLARCLGTLGEKQTATDVVQALLKLDPSDPLRLKDLLA